MYSYYVNNLLSSIDSQMNMFDLRCALVALTFADLLKLYSFLIRNCFAHSFMESVDFYYLYSVFQSNGYHSAKSFLAVSLELDFRKISQNLLFHHF